MAGEAPSARFAEHLPQMGQRHIYNFYYYFSCPIWGRQAGAGLKINSEKNIMPAKRSNPGTMCQAAKLRKVSTPAEKKLWAYLRGDKLNGVSFRRQHAIRNFIPDFVSIKRKLIIELGGSQHLEQAEYDVERSKYYGSLGYKVIRFWNNQVENDTPVLACWCKCCGCCPRD